MVRCAGVKRDGGQCTTVVGPPQTHCYQHDPGRADERRRNASRAARSKPSKEIVGVKAQLRELARDVLAGDLETGRAAVANQLINTRLRAMDLEIKIRQADELEARVEQLERSEKPGKGTHGTFG